MVCPAGQAERGTIAGLGAATALAPSASLAEALFLSRPGPLRIILRSWEAPRIFLQKVHLCRRRRAGVRFLLSPSSPTPRPISLALNDGLRCRLRAADRATGNPGGGCGNRSVRDKRGGPEIRNRGGRRREAFGLAMRAAQRIINTESIITIIPTRGLNRAREDILTNNFIPRLSRIPIRIIQDDRPVVINSITTRTP